METLKLLNGQLVQLAVSETEKTKRYECNSKAQALEVSMTLLLAGNVCTTICRANEYAVEIKKAN